jgi:hypothetical protein
LKQDTAYKLQQQLKRVSRPQDWQLATAEGGRDGDALEDVDAFFDHSIIKEQLELAVRMSEVVRATSEWHRRMTSENLSQSGQTVDLEKYDIGHNAYFYKPQKSQTHRPLRRPGNHYKAPRNKIDNYKVQRERLPERCGNNNVRETKIRRRRPNHSG